MEPSEEEKKVIKELNHFINITEHWKQKEYTNSEIDNYIKILLSLNEKQQKEIEEYQKCFEDIVKHQKNQMQMQKKLWERLKGGIEE